MALPEGELVVNSSQGGGSKDTWVSALRIDRLPVGIPPSTRTRMLIMTRRGRQCRSLWPRFQLA